MSNKGHVIKRTKIVCTLGPASSTPEIIRLLIKAGMNVARFNLSHGTFEEHSNMIRIAREESGKLDRPVSILIDLPGPKYRTGKQEPDVIMLQKGQEFTLTTDQITGDEHRVPVNLPGLPQRVKPGDTVLMNDGAMELQVISTSDTDVKTRIIIGGKLTQGRGIAVPGMLNTGSFVTDRLRANIDYAIAQKPDFVALSFVQSPDDISQVKEILKNKNADIPVCSKIERGIAIERFDDILSVTDSVMVARGDMGVDIPLKRVPIVQKEIIRKCNMAGKAVITATQMLESMQTNIRPTRAEVTDVANAIFDGTDAVMLSEETTIGEYPVETVTMMAGIATETEKALPYKQWLIEHGSWARSQTDDLISYDACYTAERLGAVAIVAFTRSGTTASRVSKFRPGVPIIAITPSAEVCRRLQLYWGVQVINAGKITSIEGLIDTATRLALESGTAKSGDLIVITGGTPLGVTGGTNLLKVQKI
jgi:pyruvate kinase